MNRLTAFLKGDKTPPRISEAQENCLNLPVVGSVLRGGRYSGVLS